jgi:hypothetical protein
MSNKEKSNSKPVTEEVVEVEKPAPIKTLVFRRVWREGRHVQGLVLYADAFNERFRLFPVGYGTAEIKIDSTALESLSKDPVPHPNVKNPKFQQYLWSRGAVLNQSMSQNRFEELLAKFEGKNE